MTQAELEQFFEEKETPAETAISNEGERKTSTPDLNTHLMLDAIAYAAFVTIKHPNWEDILYHLNRVREIVAGGDK